MSDELVRGYDLPPVAECVHCGGAMTLVENLYYVHVDTGKTYCEALPQEPKP